MCYWCTQMEGNSQVRCWIFTTDPCASYSRDSRWSPIPTLVFLQATNDTWSGFVLQAIRMMGGFDLKVPKPLAAEGFSNKHDTDAAEFYRLAEAIYREK